LEVHGNGEEKGLHFPLKNEWAFAQKRREEKRTMKLTQRAQVEGCVFDLKKR